VDPSAIIFVALAVAWAVYLIPKALEHHEEGVRTRSVDEFSNSLRVLARREAVSRREALLVYGDEEAPPTRREQRKQDRRLAKTIRREERARRRNQRRVATASRLPVEAGARRLAAAQAARRRLRVVILLVAEMAIVAVLAGAGVFPWYWMAVPVAMLLVWLVACRVMVRNEHKPMPMVRHAPLPADGAAAEVEVDRDSTIGMPAVVAPPADPDAWDPVEVPLPTYVAKDVAHRSVRTIDLNSTGVWSSGHSEADSALAREADGVAREPEIAAEEDRRAAGS
jgi:hypothetical protein